MKTLHLIQFGLGNIGGTLIREIIKRGDEKNLNYVCVADSERYCLNLEGIERKMLEKILNYKKDNGIKKPMEFKQKPDNNERIIKRLMSIKNSSTRCVLIDVTDAEEMYDTILYAFKNGIDVVTANKKPLCVHFRKYRKLVNAQEESNTTLRYEATVGAGFPIISKLKSLMDSGDEILEIKGCFSGSLGYILSELNHGENFPEVVKKAREKGYTEPDPMEDLSGRDMARKALILARSIGLKADLEDVEIESLISESLLEEKIKNAKKQGAVLKYIAVIRGKKSIKVGLKKFPLDSHFGRLRVGERITVIRTRGYYNEKPLVITGSGAGPKATAERILDDISLSLSLS